MEQFDFLTSNLEKPAWSKNFKRYGTGPSIWWTGPIKNRPDPTNPTYI